MDKIQFKAKFFGTKNVKDKLSNSRNLLWLSVRDKVEDALRLQGWQTIHGLKIRKVE